MPVNLRIYILGTCYVPPIVLSRCYSSFNRQTTTWICTIFFFFVFLPFLRLLPAAYGGSQARSLIGVVVTSLCHSRSYAGSQPYMQPTPQLIATPNP